VLAKGWVKMAAAVVVLAGGGFGLGDGDDFDDAGCTVAQRPAASSQAGHSAKTDEGSGKKARETDGGSAAGGEPPPPTPDVAVKPACEVLAERCVHRAPGGRCRTTRRRRRVLEEGHCAEKAGPASEGYDAVLVVVERIDGKVDAIRNGLSGLRVDGGGRAEVQIAEGEARKVFLLLWDCFEKTDDEIGSFG